MSLLPKPWLVLAVTLLVLGFQGTPVAQATNFGTNITIPDTFYQSSSNPWYDRGLSPKAGEDQETEGISPGTQTGQRWDNEAFFLTGSGNATTLSMVSGFNFKNGYENVTTGDIFIGAKNKTPSLVWGTAATMVPVGNVSNSLYHWDYVIQLDFASGTAKAYKLTDGSLLQTVTTWQFTQDSPWKYVSGGTPQGSQSLSQYLLSDAQVTPLPFGDPSGSYQGDSEIGGPSHYGIDLSLAWLSGGDYYFHYTFGCGNDVLMGLGTVTNHVPIPASVLLLGTGLVGLVGLKWRRRKAA